MGPFATATYGSQNRMIGSWYNDEVGFIFSSAPWFLRGGEFSTGTMTGVFDFGRTPGNIWHGRGFRVVLAV